MPPLPPFAHTSPPQRSDDFCTRQYIIALVNSERINNVDLNKLTPAGSAAAEAAPSGNHFSQFRAQPVPSRHKQFSGHESGNEDDPIYVAMKVGGGRVMQARRACLPALTAVPSPSADHIASPDSTFCLGAQHVDPDVAPCANRHLPLDSSLCHVSGTHRVQRTTRSASMRIQSSAGPSPS